MCILKGAVELSHPAPTFPTCPKILPPLFFYISCFYLPQHLFGTHMTPHTQWSQNVRCPSHFPHSLDLISYFCYPHPIQVRYPQHHPAVMPQRHPRGPAATVYAAAVGSRPRHPTLLWLSALSHPQGRPSWSLPVVRENCLLEALGLQGSWSWSVLETWE